MSFNALIWKYGNGFGNAHIDEQSKIIIDKWNLPLPEPTAQEIQQAIDEYTTYLQQLKKEEKEKKARIKKKLGLTDEDIEDLKLALG